MFDYVVVLFSASPYIVVSPPPLISVKPSYTININCTAIGIPTPEIVWRLNWGCVPEKCTMSSTDQVKNIIRNQFLFYFS